MYQNIYYNRHSNTVHLFDDLQGHLQFEYKKYCYIKASNGRYSALDGTRVEKITHWDADAESEGISMNRICRQNNGF